MLLKLLHSKEMRKIILEIQKLQHKLDDSKKMAIFPITIKIKEHKTPVETKMSYEAIKKKINTIENQINGVKRLKIDDIEKAKEIATLQSELQTFNEMKLKYDILVVKDKKTNENKSEKKISQEEDRI
jgi:hypothetical protein